MSGPPSTDKKGKKKRKAAAQNDAETESPQLQAEVAAFASQLGLGGGGGGGGADHAFEDFAPQQARQQLGAASKRKASAAAADGDVDEPGAEPAAAPAAKKRRGKPPGAAAGVGQQAEQPFVPPVSDAMAAAIREREWNAGVGPRPGKRHAQHSSTADRFMACMHVGGAARPRSRHQSALGFRLQTCIGQVMASAA